MNELTFFPFLTSYSNIIIITGLIFFIKLIYYYKKFNETKIAIFLSFFNIFSFPTAYHLRLLLLRPFYIFFDNIMHNITIFIRNFFVINSSELAISFSLLIGYFIAFLLEFTLIMSLLYFSELFILNNKQICQNKCLYKRKIFIVNIIIYFLFNIITFVIFYYIYIIYMFSS